MHRALPLLLLLAPSLVGCFDTCESFYDCDMGQACDATTESCVAVPYAACTSVDQCKSIDNGYTGTPLCDVSNGICFDMAEPCTTHADCTYGFCTLYDGYGLCLGETL